MVQKKRPVTKNSKSKKVVVPPISRFRMWVLSAVIVAILGFGLSWLLAYNDVYFGQEISMVAVVFAVIGVFLIFYAGFAVLGKFGLLRAPLALFATLALFFGYNTWGVLGTTVSSLFWTVEIPVKSNLWITPESGVTFAASFLLIASLATLLQAFLKRQKHRPSVTVGLIVLAVVSLFVVLF